MPGSLRSNWVWFDLSYSPSVANNDRLREVAMPFPGTIMEVWTGINTLLTTGGGVLAVAKNAVNVLKATNVNLGAAATPDLTAGVAAKQTLAESPTSLRVAAGDMLKATWTLTTAASTNAGTCLVAVLPDYM